MDDYITSQTPDKGVQIGPEPPISNGSMALTPDKGVQIGKELPIIDASTALTPDKGVQIGPEPPIDNYNIAMEPDKGVQIGPELPISNDSIAMTSDTVPGFAGNLIEAGIVLNGTKSAVYKSTAYPANADGAQRPGAVVEYSSEFSVGEGIGKGVQVDPMLMKYAQCVTVADMKAVNSSYRKDLTEDGKWIYSLKSLQNGTSAFQFLETIKGFEGSLRSLVQGKEMFGDTHALVSFNIDMNELVEGYGMFWASGIRHYTGKLPKLKSAIYYFCSCNNMVKYEVDMPSLENGNSMFALMNNFESFKGALLALSVGRYMFYRSPKFAHFESALPQLNDGEFMFTDCKLDKASALRVLNSIPSYGSGTHKLTFGVHVDHQNDDEIIAAIANAETKGWTLEVQWNGEATVQTASTFGLRKPPIYAKLGSMQLPDGTTENILDWGHYVTNAEENGYMEFSNVDAAVAYWELTPYVDPEAEEEFSQEL